MRTTKRAEGQEQEHGERGGRQGECLVAGFIITRCVASRLVADASPFARVRERGQKGGGWCWLVVECEKGV